MAIKDETEESCGSRAVASVTKENPRQQRMKLEVYGDVLQRIQESNYEEANFPDFDDQLWLHFNRLPARYAMDVNVERAEDVLTHQTLLKLAEDPATIPVFEVRCVQAYRRRFPIKCSSSKPEDGVDSAPSLSSSSSSSAPSEVSIDTSTYNWYTGLGGIGMLDTAYLTYLKLTGSDAFCPVSGGTCGDVLNSDYALVFGVPLPVIGFVMYGLVTALSAQLGEGNHLPLGVSKTNGRFALFAATTTMASASAYFLYILSTKLSGSSCMYCLVSAFLSFSLFFLSLKDVKLQEIQQVVGLQICLAVIVVASLTASYSTAQAIPSRSGDIELPYYSTEITTSSSPYAVALAKHLNSIGAKMYGAFWCSHCLEQKEMFGREAAKLLNYVECFPDGYKKGVQIFKACSDARIEGFPTWMINGQVLSGEVELAELAEMSGFTLDQANETNQLK